MAEEVQKTCAVEEKAPSQVPESKPEENGKSVVTAGKNSVTEITAELATKIVNQLNYYFGDFNLPRDKFLSTEIKKEDGWIPLTTMIKFERLKRLTEDIVIIANAIKTAEKTIMEVNSDMTKIRRSADHPLPDMMEDFREESIKRTIYCKGFPKNGSVTLDELLEFFKQFGDLDSVKMRMYSDRTSQVTGFKGSVLVIFKTEELAKKFIEKPPVAYKKIYLIRKWYGDYLEEKKTEIEERKAKKLAKLANGKAQEIADLPAGLFLRATGFADNTSREDIKAAILDLTNDCAFIEFKKGDSQAYIRFSEADSNKTMLAALKDTLKVKDAKIEMFLVEGEEEEEQLQKANEARRKAMSAGPHGGKKRKNLGGFRKNKRQRTK